ncbi:MAG: Lrp/AsnC ligand binding domain-containing protein [Candidatus Bathyarchaeia archaeon]
MLPEAYVLINTDIGAEETVVEELTKIQEVKETWIVYGIYDVIANVATEKRQTDLENVIITKIRGLENIISTVTMIVMEPKE